MRVAVFCASANEVEPCYFREAGRLGKKDRRIRGGNSFMEARTSG